jgi:outer membrane protein TolC
MGVNPRLMGMLAAAGLLASLGCSAAAPRNAQSPQADYYRQAALAVEYPDVDVRVTPDLVSGFEPKTVDERDFVYRNVSLQEAIEFGLRNSRVMLDLGGTVVRSPRNVRTAFDPAIQESDPILGVEGALSAFDAQLSASLFGERNDRRFNNLFIGDAGFFDQDRGVGTVELSKRSATGGAFAVRNVNEFDRDNSPANQFAGGGWTAIVEGEVRQPVLQGAGATFNRIAGPDAVPGVYNGVVIARTRTDITLAEFEVGLRDFVSNIENAYWSLYFAYRDLDAKIRARDAALETWRNVEALHRAGRRGGEADKEAQAREQYFRFQEEVQNALGGRLLEGTRTYNGSPAGTFRAVPGVQVAERRLRLLMGLPANGPELLRPGDEPPVAPVAFDWRQVTAEALALRAELRRQRWELKAREMELVAARNFLLPELDLVALYRFRGFGHDLIDAERDGRARFDNAYMDLTSGDFQEWQLGLEYEVPIGFRRGYAAVRNAQLEVARARALLREQERTVVNDLSNAVAEVDRAFAVLHTALDRVTAARQQLFAVETAYRDQPTEVYFFVMLDSQRRLAEAESDYYLARVDYALAIRGVHFEKGSLLDYCGITLAEGPWPQKAYVDAVRREASRGAPLPTNYGMYIQPVVGRGTTPPPVDLPPPPGPGSMSGEQTEILSLPPPSAELLPGVTPLPQEPPLPRVAPPPDDAPRDGLRPLEPQP